MSHLFRSLRPEVLPHRIDSRFETIQHAHAFAMRHDMKLKLLAGFKGISLMTDGGARVTGAAKDHSLP